MILGSSELLEMFKKGLVEGYVTDNVGGAGYDLRLGHVYELKTGGQIGAKTRTLPEIELVQAEEHFLGPGEYVLVETMEKVNMPDDLAARVLNRSSLFRCGAALENALVDPGYRGTLTFGLKNNSKNTFKVEQGAPIAQIVFERVQGSERSYDGRYQGGKVV